MNRSGRGIFIPDSEDLSLNENLLDVIQRQVDDFDPSSANPGLWNEDEENDFLGILHFTTEYPIPSVDLGKLGVSGDPRIHDRIAYTLGTGHTSVVIRHVTESNEAVDVVPKGSIIALKKLLPDMSQKTNAKSSLDATYRTFKKELGIYCHPLLSEHPNICKLLFLGWEQDASLPILGLELGAYGSLEHILAAPGLGPSFLQKVHLTIDIALGLSALHHAGIIHGDLKPENVIVLEHPDRQLVGKLSDFGGVVDTQLHPGAAPEHITKLWCAPEVLFRDSEIDWAAADVYSYGLIIASIWARPSWYLTEAPDNSSFLWQYLPSVFTDQEREDLLLVLKSNADEQTNVLTRALSQLNKQTLPLLEPILRATLSSNPKNRKSHVEIVSIEAAGIAGVVARKLPWVVTLVGKQRN